MKFSVIIPVYNKANCIGEALNSVLNQTYSDVEIVVVNDGSTDNLDLAIKDYQNIKLINQDNAGVSVARNNGIKQATGEFICFLDADDLWLENHLETLNSLILKYPNEKFFLTSHEVDYLNGKTRLSKDLLVNYPDDFLCENFFKLLNSLGDGLINTNCTCINREFLLENELFFEPGEKIGEDTDMWFRIALRTPVVVSKNITTKYRREFSTATKQSSSNLEWMFARRIEDISKMQIDEQVKLECEKLIDRYKMGCSRELMTARKRKQAKEVLKTVKHKSAKSRISKVLCCLPYWAFDLACRIYFGK
ncbi:MAG: glycosyltransferase family 2 protein [Clostridia bacterium]|nr:glycosyltransferase family 2 protein [Clostridia bacterium]